MTSFTRIPVTLAVFAAMTMLLSGCIAFDAASRAVDGVTSVVSASGEIVSSTFDGSDFDGKKFY
jgi:hypothetical protein